MKLIVGLGNPGRQYEYSRHNAGFLVLDELKTKISNFQFPHLRQGFGGQAISNQSSSLSFKINNKLYSEVLKLENIILAKPTTFMNRSGDAVALLATYFKIQSVNIYVIHDDLDIVLGEYKIQKGKGPKDHNGLLSIYDKLGARDFWHVRIGIDGRRKMENLPAGRQGGKWKVENNISGEDYVLMNFDSEERQILSGVVSDVTDELLIRLQSN